MENKNYFKIEDVKKTTTNVEFIVCPSCQELYEGLVGINLEFYLRDIKEKRWEVNLNRLKHNIDENNHIFHCYECGYIFDKDTKNWQSKSIEVTAYVCPKCNELVTKTPANFASEDVGYMCPKCHIILAYYKLQKHGSGKIDVKSTTDYFHGICPNCKTEKDYGMMILRGEVIVGYSKDVRGRLIIPLKCQRCGYEDTIKIATSNHNQIKLEFE